MNKNLKLQAKGVLIGSLIAFSFTIPVFATQINNSDIVKIKEQEEVIITEEQELKSDLQEKKMVDIAPPEINIHYDFENMTKSQLQKKLDDLKNCLYYLEVLSLDVHQDYKDYYNSLKEEYNRGLYVLNNNLYKYPYTQEEYNLLAKVVMREQGDNRSSDEAQMLVACVVLNRVKNNGINGDLSNPTILDILLEPGQYSQNYSWNVDTSNITDKVWENTRKVLEHEYEAPANVLFQATFKQGSGVYKAFYNEGYNNYTYFCYL